MKIMEVMSRAGETTVRQVETAKTPRGKNRPASQEDDGDVLAWMGALPGADFHDGWQPIRLRRRIRGGIGKPTVDLGSSASVAVEALAAAEVVGSTTSAEPTLRTEEV